MVQHKKDTTQVVRSMSKSVNVAAVPALNVSEGSEDVSFEKKNDKKAKINVRKSTGNVLLILLLLGDVVPAKTTSNEILQHKTIRE